MEKGKVNSDGKPDPENSLDFSEHFNLLELLETHGHLIPTGTQSLWVGNSDEDEEQDEKTEEWYQLQEKKDGKRSKQIASLGRRKKIGLLQCGDHCLKRPPVWTLETKTNIPLSIEQPTVDT